MVHTRNRLIYRIEKFKCLESTERENKKIVEDVTRVKLDTVGCSENPTGVLCDKKVPLKVIDEFIVL